MPLVCVKTGQLRVLRAFLDGTAMFAFPFKNDRTPLQSDTLAAYSEANFSGYGGPLVLGPWPDPVWESGRGITRGPSLTWTHDGGATNNNLYGVCWVQTAGSVLLFAERDPRAPVVIDPDHRVYTYGPILTDRAEFSP